MNWIPWRSSDSKEDSGGGQDTIKLHMVEWEEEVERTYELETVRLVWGGGAEKEITHCPEMTGRHMSNIWEYLDENMEPVLQVEEQPAYKEVVETEELTRVETKRRTSWMDSVENLPGGVELRGPTKEVKEV